MVTCDQQDKVSSSVKILLWIFLQIRNLTWRYAMFNRLLVGSALISLNIEFQQDDRTVCCSHRTVEGMFTPHQRSQGTWHFETMFITPCLSPGMCNVIPFFFTNPLSSLVNGLLSIGPTRVFFEAPYKNYICNFFPLKVKSI